MTWTCFTKYVESVTRLLFLHIGFVLADVTIVDLDGSLTRYWYELDVVLIQKKCYKLDVVLIQKIVTSWMSYSI